MVCVGLVLAKTMKVTKEIRSDDKNAREGRSGWGPGGAVVCWRLLAFLGAEEARREGPPPGLVVLSVAARAPG